ncbi:hypothetical protein SAMN05421780_10481 [Flexibacter flexilis DSM 6793]|uniref:Uncharacterized protein n=1 Tax=Flexibacter flexilis DSM 6793 TaxID=927664 RepID=A0A1I1HU29_9BACT|nr:hypothetical protein [Flexibacter flexilis]SFC27072.1 hypothetical protein SAMN05421780_10481 [Flexibacter flexilis DSM 6793]
MEFKVKYIYIVLGILYFIFKQIRAAQKKQKEEAASQQGEKASVPQVSFEQLLKQIQEQNSPQPQNLEQESYTGTYRNIEAENMDVSEREYKQERKRRKAKVQRYESIEPEAVESFQKSIFKEYNTAEKPNPYAKLLRNPNSVRKAVIVSELLNKKYF